MMLMVVDLCYELLILRNYGFNVDKVNSKVGEMEINSTDQTP